jgi:hypothetical protein
VKSVGQPRPDRQLLPGNQQFLRIQQKKESSSLKNSQNSNTTMMIAA